MVITVAEQPQIVYCNNTMHIYLGTEEYIDLAPPLYTHTAFQIVLLRGYDQFYPRSGHLG